MRQLVIAFLVREHFEVPQRPDLGFFDFGYFLSFELLFLVRILESLNIFRFNLLFYSFLAFVEDAVPLHIVG